MNRTGVRRLRIESCPLLEPNNRDVREPGTPLAPVHPEPLQALLDVLGQGCGRASGVPEDDHADAPRLPIADGAELDAARPGGCLPKLAGDRRNLLDRAMAEK